LLVDIPKVNRFAWAAYANAKGNSTHTFIKALESSPVHCLKPRPCGNLRRPANGGATAILLAIGMIQMKQRTTDIPAVNISYDRFPCCTRITLSDILVDPLHKVVFEDAFNDLVEKVRW
jgi:hypothetical protein